MIPLLHMAMRKFSISVKWVGVVAILAVLCGWEEGGGSCAPRCKEPPWPSSQLFHLQASSFYHVYILQYRVSVNWRAVSCMYDTQVEILLANKQRTGDVKSGLNSSRCGPATSKWTAPLKLSYMRHNWVFTNPASFSGIPVFDSRHKAVVISVAVNCPLTYYWIR